MNTVTGNDYNIDFLQKVNLVRLVDVINTKKDYAVISSTLGLYNQRTEKNDVEI